MIKINTRIRQLQKKYKKEAQRFQRLKDQLKKAQSFQRLLRYERQLQRLGIAAGLSMTLLGLSPQAQAQVYPFQQEFRVNTETSSSQSAPSIAIDADGDFVVVWESNGQDGDGTGVYAQRYNSDGTPAGAEFRVNTETSSNQVNPSIAMDADGDFVVVWQSFGQDGSSNGVYAQRYNSDGSTAGTEFPVNTYTTYYQQNPSIAMDADGDFVITWESGYIFGSGQDGSYFGVYAQRYNSDGSTAGTEFRVNSYTTSYQRNPSIAMDSDGDFVVVWQSSGQDDSSSGVYAQRYNSDGSKAGIEFQVNTETNSSQSEPSIAMDADGDFVVVWRSYGQDGSNDGVYAQRHNSDGTRAGIEFQVNTETNSSQGNPSIAMDSDGDFVVIWQSYDQDGDRYGVYAQRYNSDGSTAGGEFQVNTETASSQSSPSIAVDADGDFVVVWQSIGQDGSDYGVYAQKYKMPTESVAAGGEFQVNTETSDDQDKPSIAMDADGDFVVVWQSEQDGSSYGVYAQRYNSDGTPAGTEFQVNTETSSYQNNPSIAMDADGDFVMAWQSYGQDGSYYGVYAQRYNSDGSAAGTEFQVNTETDDYQDNPSIAMDADGDFVVVWQSLNQDGSRYGVYAQRYNSDGSKEGGEFKVNTETSSSQSKPSIAMDADGDFVVVWQSGQDGDDYGVYAQRYNSDGSTAGIEFRVNSETNDRQSVPSIAMDADGDFVVVWQSRDQDGDSYGVYAQRYNSDGSKAGAEFQVNTETASSQSNPSIAMDADGDFVIAWDSGGQDGDRTGVYAQRYNSDGSKAGAEFPVNSETSDRQRNPNIAMDADGDFVVVWDSGNQDGDQDGVYAQRYENVPLTCDGEVMLPTAVGDYQSAFADTDGDGWTHYCTACGELLLGVQKGSTGVDIADDAVELEIGATAATYYAAGTGFITNPNGAVLFNRTWDVAPTSQPSSDLPVRYFFTEAEYQAVNAELNNQSQLALASPEDLSFYKTTADGNTPVADLTTANTTILTFGKASTSGEWALGNRTDGNYYAEFAVSSLSGGGGGGADAGTALPVELLSFKGQLINDQVQLDWQTASETNNEGFYIERSENGKTWKQLGFVKGAGTTLVQQDYSFLDEQPLTGVSYYRLQQVDFDGSYEYSPIISIQQTDKSQALQVHPNPVQAGFLQVQVPTELIGQSVQVELHNNLGQIIELHTIQATNTVAMEFSRLQSRVYTLVLSANGKRWSERVVVE